MKLTIELVPQTSWFKNLRSLLSESEWKQVRTKCYKNANYKCEICGNVGNKHPVECHEEWEYDDTNHIQTLKRLIVLCPSCHEVKHIGLAKIKGNFDRAIKHLMKINNINYDNALDYVLKVFYTYHNRSTHNWELNTDYLNLYKESTNEIQN